MVADRNGTRPVDRILFGFGARREFGVVASSLGSDEVSGWERRLGTHLRPAHPDRPECSLWYWSGRDEAAVICRLSGAGDGQPDDRTDTSRVLVGSNRILTCRTALALHGWPGWHGDGWRADGGRDGERPVGSGRLGRLTRTELAGDNRAAGGPFRRGDLVAMVRPLLARPDLPLSVVARDCEPATRIALLRSLLDVLEDLFSARGGRAAAWTFSTFEAGDGNHAPWRPRVIFLQPPLPRPRARSAERSWVRLPGEPPRQNDRYWQAANALVGRYLDHGFGHMMDWLDRSGILGADTVHGRLQLLLAMSGHGGGAGAGWARPGWDGTDPAERPPRRLLPDLRGHADLELVQLLDGAVPETAEHVVAEVRRRRVAIGAHRAEVRRWLLANAERAALGSDGFEALVHFAIDPVDVQDDAVAWQLCHAIARDEVPPAFREALRRFAIERTAAGVVRLGPRFRAALRAAASW